ncbi:MAG: ATP-binding cassette domain-containing protein [Kiritimatiellae bacterium]|nr:ATP-binding cassette domain-containing protein [Kiritimatiellia bacterium]MDD5520821.1 ATP-binding cassette domain-containing protein [Kiritimatiellia bacterium]
MIKVENLTKRFGRTLAIDNLSFEVKRGEIVGFLGPNGAGKTTTMRVLSCFLPATGGKVTIGGFDVFSDSLEVRRRIGYLPENVPLYMDMRVNEYLGFRAVLKGLFGKKKRQRVSEVIEACGLTDVENSIIGRLSKGYRQRLGLADSLVHEPELLILDEPTIGLDPNQIRHIRNLIKSLAHQHTVLLSSHILPEVEMICERVLIINKGRIVASDTPGNLVGLMSGNPRTITEVMGPSDKVLQSLEKIPGVVKVTFESCGEWSRYVCDCRKDMEIRSEIFKTVSANGWIMRELMTEKRNLEDVFVEVTMEEKES